MDAQFDWHWANRVFFGCAAHCVVSCLTCFVVAPNVHALCVGDCFSAWSVVTNMLKRFPRFKNPLSSIVESDALHRVSRRGDGALLPSTLWPDRWSSTTSVPDRTTLNSEHRTTIAGVSCVETQRCALTEPIQPSLSLVTVVI